MSHDLLGLCGVVTLTKMEMVMFGEKASLLLFLCFLYITPLVNGTDAGEWFGVLRAVVEADDRLSSTAHCL